MIKQRTVKSDWLNELGTNFGERTYRGPSHNNDVIMTAITSQIISLMVVYSTFIQTQIKETSKLRVTGLCVGNSPGPLNSPHKGPVTRKMFPFDDVIVGCDLFHAAVNFPRREAKMTCHRLYLQHFIYARSSHFVVVDNRSILPNSFNVTSLEIRLPRSQ